MFFLSLGEIHLRWIVGVGGVYLRVIGILSLSDIHRDSCVCL